MVVRGLITVEDTEVVLYTPHPVRRVSKHITAAEVMSRDVTSVARDAAVNQVAHLMLGKAYRAVPVVENGAPVGIITNSDLVVRGGLGVRLELLPSLETPELHAELQRLAQTQKVAQDVMTPAPTTVPASTPLALVADVMAHRHLKRLPVVDDSGKLAGMISRLDLLRTVAEGIRGEETEGREVGLNGAMRISRLIRREVPTVHPDTSIGELLQAVTSTRLNRAVVVDSARRVVGMVTDSELLDRVSPSMRPSALHSLMNRLPFVHHSPEDLAAEHHSKARTAGDLMTTDVPTTFEETPLREAIVPMLHGKEKLLVVVDKEKRLVGIVDRADILRGLVEPSA
jgi:CBS domain-containing protein